jgi:sugar-phosphatase
MISAVIFDMDGVLIDSEPFWKEADIQAYKKVGLVLTKEQCKVTAGMDSKSAVNYWYNLHPWKGKALSDVAEDIEAFAEKLIAENGVPMEGLEYILSFFESRNIPIALASSSKVQIIETVLEKLKIKDRFVLYHSAEFEKQGKPHPAVFLTTAKKLGIQPSGCLVFEDSINGVIAAKAAGMKVVALPDKYLLGDEKFKIADLMITSLNDFGEKQFQNLL